MKKYETKYVFGERRQSSERRAETEIMTVVAQPDTARFRRRMIVIGLGLLILG